MKNALAKTTIASRTQMFGFACSSAAMLEVTLFI
jgi:hypothetical protein